MASLVQTHPVELKDEIIDAVLTDNQRDLLCKEDRILIKVEFYKMIDVVLDSYPVPLFQATMRAKLNSKVDEEFRSYMLKDIPPVLQEAMDLHKSMEVSLVIRGVFRSYFCNVLYYYVKNFVDTEYFNRNRFYKYL